MFDAFRAFCAQLQIPSKDRGLVPFSPWWGTQEELHRGVQRGGEGWGGAGANAPGLLSRTGQR